MLGAESLGYMAGNLGMVATERAAGVAAGGREERRDRVLRASQGHLQQASMAVAANQRGQEFQGMREFFAQGGTPEDLQKRRVLYGGALQDRAKGILSQPVGGDECCRSARDSLPNRST